MGCLVPEIPAPQGENTAAAGDRLGQGSGSPGGSPHRAQRPWKKPLSDPGAEWSSEMLSDRLRSHSQPAVRGPQRRFAPPAAAWPPRSWAPSPSPPKRGSGNANRVSIGSGCPFARADCVTGTQPDATPGHFSGAGTAPCAGLAVGRLRRSRQQGHPAQQRGSGGRSPSPEPHPRAPSPSLDPSDAARLLPVAKAQAQGRRCVLGGAPDPLNNT